MKYTAVEMMRQCVICGRSIQYKKSNQVACNPECMNIRKNQMHRLWRLNRKLERQARAR